MDPRKYNIYFHTHTISGIIIAAILYVIFFAGSFSFFKDDISAWQKGKSIVARKPVPGFNNLIDSLSHKYNLQGRSFDFYIQRQGQGAYVSMTASADTTISKPKPKPKGEVKRRGRGRRGGDDDSAYFLYSFADQKAAGDYADAYDMGEFLYRLHFLAQLNQVFPFNIGTPVGYLIAGIVSFLFLFALITGLLLHWDKIRSSFFLFRPMSKWKTVWTDMHTVLGVIGFPFQFVFALTGVILIVNWVILTPAANVLYDGNTEKMYESLEFGRSIKADYTYTPMKGSFDMDAFVAQWSSRWPGSQVTRVHIANYQDESMQVSLEAKPNPEANFAGSGFVHVQVASGKILAEKSPVADASYIDGVKSLVYHLHFGDFGGKPLRIVFFILGLMGCAVIISGILIWLVARDKVSTEKRKRTFNFWASNVFLAACLSMLPVTAFTLIMLKVLPKVDQAAIYHTYFYSWLALSTYFIVRRSFPLMNRQALLLSAVLCLTVPVANGMATGLWMWATWQQGAFDIFFIDALFLVLSVCCAFAWKRVRSEARPFRILDQKNDQAGTPAKPAPSRIPSATTKI
ncbi:PepSY-associated TM helix domain-containing protein [Dyadobacter sandarakinus]|uniref:PepSY domain-containing protein n=1 Tax=Dyadobacter sandarakinus TaxID=2747268 RepID=A0ABX7I5B6_9BACT|nr:PepSY-associated TM helix domain-containing protein [Dyadobacter sandarakinus]QRR01294.1 PepSY domain-containing protein [Dyadobacter sandarakinus]